MDSSRKTTISPHSYIWCALTLTHTRPIRLHLDRHLQYLIWIACCRAYDCTWAIHLKMQHKNRHREMVFWKASAYCISHTFLPRKCPHSADLAIFSATFKCSNFSELSFMCVFLQFSPKQPLERQLRRNVWVGCLLDNTLEVKINVCQTKWNVRL